MWNNDTMDGIRAITARIVEFLSYFLWVDKNSTTSRCIWTLGPDRKFSNSPYTLRTYQ